MQKICYFFKVIKFNHEITLIDTNISLNLIVELIWDTLLKKLYISKYYFSTKMSEWDKLIDNINE